MNTRVTGNSDPLLDPTNTTITTGIRMLNTSGAGTSHAVRHSESESDEEEPQEQFSERQTDSSDTLIQTLRRMGIKSPKPFDPKRDKNFEIWLERTELHLKVNKCLEQDKQVRCYFF